MSTLQKIGVGRLYARSSPRRTFGRRCFGCPAWRISARFRPLRVGQGTGRRVAPQIVAGQFVNSLEIGLQVAGQLLGTQSGPFLNANPIGQKKVDVSGDGQVSRGFAFDNDVETVNTRTSLLAKTEVSKFHEGFPFYALT